MNLHEARWWMQAAPDKAFCELCPRSCLLREGQHGFCGVRRMEGGALKTSAFDTTRGLCIDPIEKKPLYHFWPGSRVLSFGMHGCTLACDFCQNASLSQGDEANAGPAQPARPEELVRLAKSQDCIGVAFTYNEPIVSIEWCLEVATAFREAGLRTLAITSGYISQAARAEFFGAMDATNVDLKCFSDSFYRRHCLGSLQPVLETLAYLAQEGRIWLEVTTLLIPGENDDEGEIGALADWMMGHLGPEVPLHFSAFHPAHRMMDRPRTPAPTLRRARKIAMERGLRFVYTGNILDAEGSTTFCPGCGQILLEREGFRILSNRIRDGLCPNCGTLTPGHFAGKKRGYSGRPIGAKPTR